jgi:hypothetical protein
MDVKPSWWQIIEWSHPTLLGHRTLKSSSGPSTKAQMLEEEELHLSSPEGMMRRTLKTLNPKAAN